MHTIKKTILILTGIVIGALSIGSASADTISQLNPWITSVGYVKVASSTAGVWIPSLGAPGNPCVTVGTTGKLSTSACGSGSQTPWTGNINGGGYTLSNAYLTATATTLDLSGVTNSLVYANGIGRLTAIATTSLGLPTFSSLSSYLSLSSWYATTTDGLDEGLTNKYFSNALAISALAGLYEVPLTFTYPIQRTVNAISLAFGTTTANTWSGINIFSNSASTFAGTAGKATILETARAINGVNFDGSAPITITAASSTLLGDTNTWSATNQFAKLTFTNATGTNATTSSLAISNLSAGLVKALTGGSLVNAVAGVDYQAPGSYITLASLSATAPIAYNSGTGAFSWTGLATTSQPASSNVLVSNGGAGVYGVATGTVSATLPLSVTAGRSVLGGALSVTIADAVADASTKGASTYVANDFNATAGSISIDYTNGQAAATGAKGFLTSTDWNTFNGKESVLTFNYPLTRSANAISSALSTTTANIWSTTQTFTVSPVFSSLTGLLKGNGASAVTVASVGTDYVNGSGTNGNCVAWGASNALTDAGAPCGSGTGGGGTSQWATSTLYSNMIHTAGAHGIGIGTTTPIGSLTVASSSRVTTWWNHTGASANSKLGWMSWANGIFDIGTSTDAGATTSKFRIDSGTTTSFTSVLAVTNGSLTSRLIAGTGTSTPAGGIDIPSGCYATGGVCLGTMALSGSVGQVNYYSGVNTAVGTSSLFISLASNVGIGTTSPWAKLSIDTKTTAGTYPLFVVASSSASQFVINSFGKVGIGTSTPFANFDIFSTGTSTISIDSNSATKGGCGRIKDRDGVGYTYFTANDGVLFTSTTSCF